MPIAEFLKTLLPPLLISLALFLLITYLLLPLYRHHRNRYRSYAPLSSSFESPVSLASLRDLSAPFRAVAALLPAAWRWEYLSRFRRGRGRGDGAGDGADGRGEAEAEGMLDMPPGYDQVEREEGWGRRDRLGDTERRLSRELEEGFRDDSDEE
ncbi:hypothetical protein P152DRAFT_515450 [Eremomyces bilateralis CBS 781.70]|uniref:Uncharacterized protein n=1 Tax=Eremomyces bilateralis CBS 781.70 TaxID=1392243 RepID=A0A6G1FYX4_9PEZI|nr:uncharacterized protein P152DRAFT_515450 [Eremomyces bilateralis CBS 781.70]KAF1811047.1 hypothetical protein P152DRAFT_515450 [Eremomyces bilateralis CBS 781.70]